MIKTFQIWIEYVERREPETFFVIRPSSRNKLRICVSRRDCTKLSRDLKILHWIFILEDKWRGSTFQPGRQPGSWRCQARRSLPSITRTEPRGASAAGASPSIGVSQSPAINTSQHVQHLFFWQGGENLKLFRVRFFFRRQNHDLYYGMLVYYIF